MSHPTNTQSNAFETILFEKRDSVAHISLNRPDCVNAYNIQMRDDFSEALLAVELDPDIRALLITGEGRGFCAGADLTEFGSAPSQVIARRVRWDRDVWGQLIDLDKPIIAGIHGFCIGSGLEIALPRCRRGNGRCPRGRGTLACESAFHSSRIETKVLQFSAANVCLSKFQSVNF